MLTRQPRLPVRLHRPYLAANLAVSNCWRRYVTIMRYSAGVVGGRIQLIFEYPRAATGEAGGKNGEQFTLELTMMISMDKEVTAPSCSATAKVFLWQSSLYPV